MVSRIMLSLKKAADPRKGDWSLAQPTMNDKDLQSAIFFRTQGLPNGEQDDVLLETILEAQTETR
jgi:hypothetical protein